MSDVSIQSRKVRDAIKHDIPGKIDAIVERLSQQHINFPGWFGRDLTVIPIPNSSPFPHGPFISPENTLWVSKQICLALVKHGLAAAMVPCLKRIHSVKKSAYSSPGDRPSVVAHYESIECNPALISTPRALVVDDVITKGRTMLASASRIAEVFPNLKIQGFAILRTMGLVADIERIIDCCTGTLEFSNWEVYRNP